VAATPGYSGTPLTGKLGIKAGMQLVAIRAPKDYASLLGALPAGASVVSKKPKVPAAVHLFATKKAELKKELVALRQCLDQAGFIWVSWPKRTSGVATDITEDTIRDVALPMGFVDIKVCAVTEVWSGLKLVIRKTERG
jgi:hypothetical protein